MPGSANHTITSCVPSTTTLCANYVVGDVWLILTLPRPVVRCTTIRAWRQYAVLSEGAIEHRQLPQLHLAQLVGALRQINPLLNDLLDLCNCFLHFDRLVTLNISMKGFVFPRHWLVTNLYLSFLHTSLAPYHNLAAAHLFHRLEGVAPWSYEKTHKV